MPNGLTARVLKVLGFILVAVLLLVALARITLPADSEALAFVASIAVHAGWVAGAAAAMLLLLALFKLGRNLQLQATPTIDAKFLLVGLSWLAFLLCLGWVRVAGGTVVLNGLLYALYQLTAVAMALFLLGCLPRDTTKIKMTGWIYLWATEAIILMAFVRNDHMVEAVLVWRVSNVLACTALLLLVCRDILRKSNTRHWVVAGGVVIGWVALLSDMTNMAATEVHLVQVHYILAAYLVLTWLYVTGRLKVGETNSALAGDKDALNRGRGTSVVDETKKGQEQANLVRHRIAQDLHDGVGSQIVSIISSLDYKEPLQRDLASALEHCLLDLKTLVDEIEDSDESVQESLGRLRYRVQHSLDRLGIDLSWSVDIDGPLGQVKAHKAQQVLHVARESLANTMRHSKAHQVSVRLHSEQQPLGLLLEIEDDGVGFSPPPPGQPTGRGLRGMRQRIRSIGGEIEILSKLGHGTLVRVRLPITDSP